MSNLTFIEFVYIADYMCIISLRGEVWADSIDYSVGWCILMKKRRSSISKLIVTSQSMDVQKHSSHRYKNVIGGVMVTVFTSSAVHRWFESQSG